MNVNDANINVVFDGSGTLVLGASEAVSVVECNETQSLTNGFVYTKSTGKIVCKRGGRYNVKAQICGAISAAADVKMQIFKNASAISGADCVVEFITATLNTDTLWSLNIPVDLAVDDEISVKFITSTGTPTLTFSAANISIN